MVKHKTWFYFHLFSEKNKFGFSAIPRLPVITLVWHYGFTNLDKVPYFPLEWGEVKPPVKQNSPQTANVKSDTFAPSSTRQKKEPNNDFLL